MGFDIVWLYLEWSMKQELVKGFDRKCSWSESVRV